MAKIRFVWCSARLAGRSIMKKALNPSVIKSDWIRLSPWRVGAFIVRNDVFNRVSANNRFYEIAHGFNLWLRKRVCSIIQIDKLNADGEIIDVDTAIFHL